MSKLIIGIIFLFLFSSCSTYNGTYINGNRQITAKQKSDWFKNR